MKNIFTTILFVPIFFGATVTLHAQDSNGVKNQIKRSNEKADNLHGKKIQQQSLSPGKFEKLDTVVSPKPLVAKQKKKSKLKH